MSHEFLLVRAGQLLTRTIDCPVTVCVDRVLYDYPGAPSTVLRCVCKGERPRYVVLKRGNGSIHPLRREAAGLEFVA